ncbi:hypothetical protein AB0875_05015 [Micromonospora gifhornensis]|uniref:hypothetical protein n=1 Tax=Micromonospora gifhornensis TaxID=84594 RepID=UPI0034535E87
MLDQVGHVAPWMPVGVFGYFPHPCCRRATTSRWSAVHEAGTGINYPHAPLHQKVAVLGPDGLAGLHQNRSIQDEVMPLIDKREAVSLLTVDRPPLPGCTHDHSIGSIPPSDKSRRPGDREVASSLVAAAILARLIE